MQTRRIFGLSALALAGVLASSAALAMPFCGDKGYKNNYRYAPAYYYPPMAPGYRYAPIARPYANTWQQPALQSPANVPAYQPAAPAQVKQPAAES